MVIPHLRTVTPISITDLQEFNNIREKPTHHYVNAVSDQAAVSQYEALASFSLNRKDNMAAILQQFINIEAIT